MRELVHRLFERIRQTVQALLKNPPIVFPLVLGAVLYAIFHRTPQEFFEELFPIFVFILIIFYCFFAMRWFLFGLPKVSVHLFLLPILYLPTIVALSSVVYYGVWVAIRDSYIWIEHLSPPRGVFVVFVGFLVVAVGYTLFLFRLHARFFFGLTEAVTGLLIALRNIPTNADPILWSSQIFIVILTAGVFLIVRGFDNMNTGLKSEPRDSILRAFDESEYGAYWRALNDKDQES